VSLRCSADVSGSAARAAWSRVAPRPAAIRCRSRAPSWMSSTRSPRPAADSRESTASIAARFSATNSTFLPLATIAAIRLAIVWDLPVPGGPWMTRLRPASTASIAARCEESASSTE
jgi:hypothetical protein